MDVLVVAIYAMVIGGPAQAFKCVDNDMETINCTNGLEVSAEKGLLHYSNGVTVNLGTGSISNGVTAHRDGTGWLEFSNGFAVHRDSPYRYRFGNGYICQLAERGMAECKDGRQ